MIPALVHERTWKLVEVTQQLSLAGSHEEIRDIVRHAARDLVDADGATFVIPEDGNCYYIDEDAISPLWKGSKFPMDICISGWAMMNKQHVIIPDVFVDDRIPHDIYRQTFVKSMIMTPIRESDPCGAIGVYWADAHEATPEEVSLLQALANTTAVAMESVETLRELEQRVAERTKALDEANERLLEMSLSDELTSLRNRRGFEMLASHEYSLTQRQETPSSIIYVDVDGLKPINDTLGHGAGDIAIKGVGQALGRVCRAADVVGRLGGDEFAAYLVADENEATEVVGRFEDELSRINVSGVNSFELKASVGLATSRPGESFADLLSRADAVMYRDKMLRKAALAVD